MRPASHVWEAEFRRAATENLSRRKLPDCPLSVHTCPDHGHACLVVGAGEVKEHVPWVEQGPSEVAELLVPGKRARR